MNDAKEFDAITVGDVFVDLIMTGFAVWPQPGEEAFAQALTREIGGGAAITANGLARLGERVALCAAIGEGSAWFVSRLRACGISDCLLQPVADDALGTTVSVSTAADRAFFTYQGANRKLPALLTDEHLIDTLTRARHVHFACALAPEQLLSLTQRLHEARTTVSLDVGWQVGWLSDARSWDVLRAIDCFFPNEREAELMTGQTLPQEMLRRFADAGLSAVALKLGAQGAGLWWHGEIHWALPLSVTPMDTTGAGDCFDAGFLSGWLRGNSPAQCLQLANQCGAYSTERAGGIASFPDWLACQR